MELHHCADWGGRMGKLVTYYPVAKSPISITHSVLLNVMTLQWNTNAWMTREDDTGA